MAASQDRPDLTCRPSNIIQPFGAGPVRPYAACTWDLFFPFDNVDLSRRRQAGMNGMVWWPCPCFFWTTPGRGTVFGSWVLPSRPCPCQLSFWGEGVYMCLIDAVVLQCSSRSCGCSLGGYHCTQLRHAFVGALLFPFSKHEASSSLGPVSIPSEQPKHLSKSRDIALFVCLVSSR